ncbi:ferredoxin [Heliophilum fasciatum]|uniref:4Fe-4S binding protein n=1 Tax=Heliophilum fasciatum TaxID=35700 RepID=A0A4R2RJI7_9FIRM|nr:ferredoxin [Heliophilum fasciatum]MCW2278177.1 Fe-S-cluster-containing hydrogenase component 2 [Heliophilum fasciatum]TCP64002.1 4Fe-4S binding protein [Heliophilum fasciatum]
MIANYGYMDGSGEYYISIDTDKCIECASRACLQVCPSQLFEIMTDDYDDEVAAIKKDGRRSLKYLCAECKPATGRGELPCQAGCPNDAIKHSW